MGNLRVYAGPEHPHEAQQPAAARCRRDEPQEQEGVSHGRSTDSNPLGSGLRDALQTGQPAPGAAATPMRAGRRRRRRTSKPKLDAHGRAYATGKRKNAVARVWIKPGTGKITVNGRDSPVYFARPVLRMLINQPFVVADRLGQFDVRLHGRRRRPLGPGRRGAPRHQQGADLLRAGAAAGAQGAAAS